MNRLTRTLCLLLLTGSLWCAASRARAVDAATASTRLVSLAPSLTRIAVQLGLGPQLVGVTRYCKVPADATPTRVGGYVDPNYEAILALQPDLVLLLKSHREAGQRLQQLGLATLSVPHETIADIHQAIQTIGQACGAATQAATLTARLQQQTRTIRQAVAGRPRPRVLVCIGRDLSAGQLAGLYAAGRNCFYDEIIELAGGVNAYTDTTVAYPQLSAEGLISLRPDVVIDLVSSLQEVKLTRADIARQWEVLPLPAVRHDRVHVIVGQYALSPGPRYVRFLTELAQLLHPAAFAPKSAP